MDRVPLARRRLRLFLLLAAAPAFALAPFAIASAAAAPGPPEGPTIIFTASGTEPLVCGIRPDVTSIQIRNGTRIIVANQTKVEVSAQVNTETIAHLNPGEGALVRLKKGQHVVRLIPECVVVTETVGVAVSVVPGLEVTPSPTPSSSAVIERPGDPGILSAPGSADTPGGPAAGNGSSSTNAADGQPPNGNPRAAVTRTASTPPGTTAAATPTPSTEPVAIAATKAETNGGSRESAVIDVRAITLGDPTDPKRNRLLAVIAAICVFGVTAAIIRAIVSQRTTSAVPL